MPKGESKRQVEKKLKKSADAKSVSSIPKERAKRSLAGVKAGGQAELGKTGKKAVKTATHPAKTGAKTATRPAKTGAKTGSKASWPAKEKMHSDEPRFGEFDAYLFGQATHHEIYQKMGAHPGRVDGVDGVWFTVWAPNAKGVGVIGEFNGWNDANDTMKKVASMGVYEKFVPGAKVGQLYKYKIYAASGDVLFKADPYAFWAEKRPGTASRIADISTFRWTDAAWMKKREKFVAKSSALSIYEVHPGSWMKHPYSPENPEGFYNYRLFAERLTEYVLDMGYTHVELMGIAEHPLDASWGYQVTGYYAPTSRYGKPEDFKYLVNYLHEHGIGVILDWVPAHFPKDEQGLANFDGQAVYEHEDPRLGEHPDWGTKIFNYGRPQVKNFLIGNALFWIEEYHVDGLRVDAVASMLYLDYGRKDGEWIPNKNGGNENLEAIEFFKHLNTLVTGKNKGVMMIAEESTAWPHVTGDVEKEDGLGFTLKWNMGWMHDFLDYMKLDPYFRKGAHNKMTFAMTYAFSENYILVLSHDEVVHLKCSMLEKMPGYEDDKFENLKVGYAFMFGHPGKKLLFMGQDFGQHREWSEERELDWFLLQDERNEHLQAFVRDLLSIYRKYPALYANDSGYEGFQWVNANDADRSIFSFIRWSPDQKNNLLFICNFTPMDRPDYCVGVPRTGSYELILDSREIKYGGSHKSEKKYRAWKGECDGQPYYISYELPPYGVAVFRFD